MADYFRPGDLLAGGGAAVMLLLLVFALGLTPWLAIPLAVATYLGIALLQRTRPAGSRGIWSGWPLTGVRPTTAEEPANLRAYEAARAGVAAIRQLALDIAKPTVRAQVDRILDRADRVLCVTYQDNELEAAALFNDLLLAPLHAMLTEYMLLARRAIKSASELLEQIEIQDLPRIEQAADNFYERLHRQQMIDLATLSELLDLHLESIRAITSRRVTH